VILSRLVEAGTWTGLPLGVADGVADVEALGDSVDEAVDLLPPQLVRISRAELRARATMALTGEERTARTIPGLALTPDQHRLRVQPESGLPGGAGQCQSCDVRCIEAINRSTRSSTETKGSLQSTVR
jgi:hypothetical protein